MNRMYQLTWALIFIGSFMNAAASNGEDICPKLSGYWRGVEHIKDQAECAHFNGCEHQFMLRAQHKQGSSYLVDIYYNGPGEPHVTHQRTAVKCEDGQIKLPVMYENTLDVKCDEMAHCFMVIDNYRFSAEMIKD